MVSKKTIALSFAAMLVSASAAMAATTHPRHAAAAAAEAPASYAAASRQGQAGPYYYEADDNGSVWANYPGYVPIARN